MNSKKRNQTHQLAWWMVWSCCPSCISELYIELDGLADADEVAGDLHAICDATRSLEAHNHKDGDKRELLGFDEGQEGPELPSPSSLKSSAFRYMR